VTWQLRISVASWTRVLFKCGNIKNHGMIELFTDSPKLPYDLWYSVQLILLCWKPIEMS
jgi:hypothetical protein